MSVKYVTRRAEDKKWCVKNANASKATRVFDTQKEAIQYAGSLKSTTAIMVQSKEGKFRKVSTWDGVNKNKEAKPTTAKKAMPAKKATTKKPTSKKPASKKPVTEEVVLKEESQSTTREKVIQELKAQNEALDQQIAKDDVKEEVLNDKESTTQEIAKQDKSNNKSKSNKIKLAIGITLFLIVIAVAVLFVADWKEWISFMDVIKTK